ncbi:hypothetical protein, partial [Yersinia kristensenii]|uniref:hypothetical protein n=1 Tax=Yersinia kristensenii TaxID=28152 RepID=UPI000A3F0E11
ILLLLVIDYGLTLFYLANPIGNDIHSVHSIKQQDISPMLNPHTLHSPQPDTPRLALFIVHPHPSQGAAACHPHLPLTLARCCP